MRETENIFDTSTSLMEIDEPAAGDVDSGLSGGPAPESTGEPDYFTPNPGRGHSDARRRALAVLGLVGGGIFSVVLLSAATGSGENRAVTTSKSPASSERSLGGRSATIVAPTRAPKASPRRQAPVRTTRTEKRHPPARHPSRPASPPHRHRHHSPAAPSAAPPPPEPSYSPEPEPTYVPVEETAPPPPETPPPSSSGGGQQEFGFEP